MGRQRRFSDIGCVLCLRRLHVDVSTKDVPPRWRHGYGTSILHVIFHNRIRVRLARHHRPAFALDSVRARPPSDRWRHFIIELRVHRRAIQHRVHHQELLRRHLSLHHDVPPIPQRPHQLLRVQFAAQRRAVARHLAHTRPLDVQARRLRELGRIRAPVVVQIRRRSLERPVIHALSRPRSPRIARAPSPSLSSVVVRRRRSRFVVRVASLGAASLNPRSSCRCDIDRHHRTRRVARGAHVHSCVVHRARRRDRVRRARRPRPDRRRRARRVRRTAVAALRRFARARVSPRVRARAARRRAPAMARSVRDAVVDRRGRAGADERGGEGRRGGGDARARRGVDASGGGAGDDGVRGVDRKRARTRASVQRGRAGGE